MKKIKTKQNRYLYILPKEANEKDHYVLHIRELLFQFPALFINRNIFKFLSNSSKAS